VHHQLIKWRGKYPISSDDYELGILSKLFWMSAYLIFVLSCRYTIIKEVGDGTFGSVWRAIHKESGEVVYHSASPFFSFVSFFFSSHTVWLPVPLPSHLIDTPVLIGCDQENEEKILFLGRVHKPP